MIIKVTNETKVVDLLMEAEKVLTPFIPEEKQKVIEEENYIDILENEIEEQKEVKKVK
ncbi:MAG: hypothetical protein ACI31M_01660 [Bacilli bacterium]